MCCFKLSGQNNYNMKNKMRFSQTGLISGKKMMLTFLLRILAEITWCNLICEIRVQKVSPKIICLELLSQTKITPKLFFNC